jgi:anti-sigma regulatory factor (Ser/Thr protein kinase)
MPRLLLLRSVPEMARLAVWLDEQERVLAIPAKTAFAIRLCLEETVANLIDHSLANNPEIAVVLDRVGDRFVVSVEDHGPPFDPGTVAAPPRPANLEEAMPGGHGIQLIRTFASEVDYAVRPDFNRLTFRFSLPGDHRPI